MSIITLLTDFGLEDEFVGVMKGVILSVCPHVRIVDISHNIEPQDILQAGHMIKSAYAYFPPETIHVIVVDPGVGTKRDIILARIRSHFFLAPDNGVLSLLFDLKDQNDLKDERDEKNDETRVYRIENSEYFLKQVSRTFHGRDIFAPICAHLANGIKPETLGTLILAQTVCRFESQSPVYKSSNELQGLVIHTDRFGNLVTDIDQSLIFEMTTPDRYDLLEFEINGKVIKGLSKHFQAVGQENPLVFIGSRGLVEVAINCGNASKYFKIGKGGKVVVRRPDDRDD